MAPLDGVDANDRQMSLKGDTLIKAASRSIESAETSARPGRILQTTTPFHFRVGRGGGPSLKGGSRWWRPHLPVT